MAINTAFQPQLFAKNPLFQIVQKSIAVINVRQTTIRAKNANFSALINFYLLAVSGRCTIFVADCSIEYGCIFLRR
jgi:hypothetical protein